MKKRLLLFIAILLCINVAYSQEDWFYSSDKLIINIDVSSGAEIKPKSSDYSVQYIKVNLSHFPYEGFNQEVIEFNPEPDAEIENNALLFEWDNPKDEINFGYKAKIKTNSDVIKITKKVPFPIINLEDDFKKFTLPAEIIDSNDEDIIELASILVGGEDDLYVVVNKIAEWTKNNINYDLSTLTAEVSQKASWVLDNRQGVCDELTSLFIAMLRSLGVPARFISGIAYTNSSLFPENWGSHGWAEVYFPGYGWVPYDVTYGQFGFTDTTHIKLKESIDSAEPSVQYKWLSRNIELDTKKLEIKASLEDKIGRIALPYSFDVNVFKDKVGFGSFNIIEVNLENLEDYYISSEIYISKPKELDLSENFIKHILLKPKEKKSVFWSLEVPDDLDKNFIYTFPITISALGIPGKSVSFISAKNDIILSSEEINDILEQKRQEEEKIYSREIDFKCEIDKNEFYAYESALLKCRIRNVGNIFLEELDLCYNDECRNFDLGIAQEKSFNFSAEKIQAGKQELAFSLENEDVSKATYVDVNVLDNPKIAIKNIENPIKVSYEDEFKIGFLLDKESASNPQNAEISLLQNGIKKTWAVKELLEDRKFVVAFLGKNLKKGLNEFSILIKYEDKNHRKYEAKESFVVELANVTFMQNILLNINGLLMNLENLTPKSLIMVLAGSFVVFISVIWLIFRRKK